MKKTKQLYQEIYATDLWLNDYIHYKKQIDEQHEQALESAV